MYQQRFIRLPILSNTGTRNDQNLLYWVFKHCSNVFGSRHKSAVDTYVEEKQRKAAKHEAKVEAPFWVHRQLDAELLSLEAKMETKLEAKEEVEAKLEDEELKAGMKVRWLLKTTFDGFKHVLGLLNWDDSRLSLLLVLGEVNNLTRRTVGLILFNFTGFWLSMKQAIHALQVYRTQKHPHNIVTAPVMQTH